MDPGSRLMTAQEAVARHVKPGAVLGLGGQNINRCPMALVHEIVRQGHGDLTVVGCNLSLPLDILAAAGLVARTEQGSGNLEKYGVLFTWRHLVEQGHIDVRDHSHLAMASRFLAGSLGLPYMPIRSLLGSDMLNDLIAKDRAHVSTNPWGGEPVVLLPTLNPDVSIIHASHADEEGNLVIDGVSSHEIDMVKASTSTIVTVDELRPEAELASHAEAVSISSAFVDAVVLQPFGAFPTSVYKRYDYCEPDVQEYQALARSGIDAVTDYLSTWILGVDTFDEYLDKRDPSGELRTSLETTMRSLV
jgi:acyl CoA:acetate/3-ketoacid CoA transferase alpha subunit